MDYNLYRRWMRRLTSGKIKQTKCLLARTETEMCCLGVLAVAMGNSPAYLVTSSKTFLSDVELEQAGITFSVASELASINDYSCRLYGVNDFGAVIPAIKEMVKIEYPKRK